MHLNFEKHDLNMLNMFDVEYDYDSVLHYSAHAFAVNKRHATIVPLKSLGDAKLGQRERLSKKDIERLNKMYCEETASDYYYDENSNESSNENRSVKSIENNNGVEEKNEE